MEFVCIFISCSTSLDETSSVWGTLPQQENKEFQLRGQQSSTQNKKCKGSLLGTQVGKLHPLQGSCASISTEKAVQDQSANLITSVRNVLQSDTGHRNVGRVEGTNGPIHNKKRSVVCC